MTVKRPSIARVLGRDYAVQFLPESKMKDEEGVVCNGLTDYSKGLIKVHEGLEFFEQRDVVLHETMHGVLYQQGKESAGNDEEESYVRPLASGILGFLRDNPDLARWLLAPKPRPKE